LGLEPTSDGAPSHCSRIFGNALEVNKRCTAEVLADSRCQSPTAKSKYNSCQRVRARLAISHSSPACARFDQFEVDLVSGELRVPGIRSMRIQQLPLQVLRLLLEAEGRVVTREQLRLALWSEDKFVDFEHGVNTAIKKLRQALEDSVEHPKFVETLPKVGYRFLVPVEWVTTAPVRCSRLRATLVLCPPITILRTNTRS